MKIFNFKIIILVYCLFVVTMPVLAQENRIETNSNPNVSYASGKILQILSEKNNKALEESFQTEQITQTAKVLILKGKYKGKIVKIQNQLTSSPVYDIKIKQGMRVILSVEETPKGVDFYIADQEKTPVLLILVGVFLSLLLLVEGKQGLKSMFFILITPVLIFSVLIPDILNNAPIVLTTMIITTISAFITIIITGGINIKSLSIMLGAILSVVITALISLLAVKFAPLNGFGTQEAEMLWTGRPDLHYIRFLTAGIIISSLGVIIHVSMFIANSIYELKKTNNLIETRKLFMAGLNAGKGMIGTMVNAFIMICIGSAFTLILLVSNSPLIKLINLNVVATEIVFVITGCIGIVICSPITAFISAYLIGRHYIKRVDEDINTEKLKTESSV